MAAGLHWTSQDVPGGGPLQVPRAPARQVRLCVQPGARQDVAQCRDQRDGASDHSEAGHDGRLSEARHSPGLEDSEARTSPRPHVRAAASFLESICLWSS